MMRSPSKPTNLDQRGAGDSDSSSSSIRSQAQKRKRNDYELTETLNTFAKSLTTINNTLSEMKLDMTKLTENSTEIRNDLNALRSAQLASDKKVSQLETKQSELSQCIGTLKESVQFNSEQYLELKNQMEQLQCKARSSSHAEDTVATLESKIDVLEQQARACNIEIGNVPERRGENLISLVETIGAKINFMITQRDIIAVHRVPQMTVNNNRPKNIVVRFSSVPFRDNVISAYRKAKGLRSDQLGVSGTPCVIYINEHLTLKKKLLFRECRSEAQKHNYKHIWVKHSTILVRKTDTSGVIAIQYHKDIPKLAAGSHDINSSKS